MIRNIDECRPRACGNTSSIHDHHDRGRSRARRRRDLRRALVLPARGQGQALRFDLGVKNLTDETYYTASGGTFRINAGAPRSVFGGVRPEF